jgi:LPXTG-motif cell wall-anchored protein
MLAIRVPQMRSTHMTPREGTEQMRYIFGWVIPLIFLPVAPGFSQGTAPPPDVGGDAGDWWWVVLMVLLSGTAVWFFMRRRGAP